MRLCFSHLVKSVNEWIPPVKVIGIFLNRRSLCVASNKSGLRKRCQRLKTQVTWTGQSPVLEAVGQISTQAVLPATCGFSQIRSKPTLPKNVRSCPGLSVGPLDLEPCFTSEHFDQMEFLVFCCSFDRFIQSSSDLPGADGGWSSRHLWWVQAASRGCQARAQERPPALLVWRRCLCDFVFPS